MEEPNSDNGLRHEITDYFHLRCVKVSGKGLLDEKQLEGMAELPEEQQSVVRTWLLAWNAKATAFLQDKGRVVTVSQLQLARHIAQHDSSQARKNICMRILMQIFVC